jgi:hypothetical protein
VVVRPARDRKERTVKETQMVDKVRELEGARLPGFHMPDVLHALDS